jgi:hypothetical protein
MSRFYNSEGVMALVSRDVRIVLAATTCVLSISSAAFANSGIQLPLGQYTAGTESTTLVPNGNFSNQGPVDGNGRYPDPPSWTRVGDSIFVDATLTPPSNPSTTSPYSAQVRNTATSDNWYSQTINPNALTTGANYVASAYIWNYAPATSTAAAYIKLIDPTFGFNNVAAGLGAGLGNDNVSNNADGALVYFMVNQSQLAGWGGVEFRATGELGDTPGVLPNVWSQFDNVALTPAENFVGQKWNVPSDGAWATAGNWAGNQVPNVAGAVASFTSSISTNHFVHVSANVTVGQINFNNSTASYTVDSTGGSITLATPHDGFNAIQGTPEIAVVAGNHTITAPVIFDSSSHPNSGSDPYRGILSAATGSSLTLTNMTATGVNLTKMGGGKATVNKVEAKSLNVGAGTLAVAVNGSNSGVSYVNTLAIDPSAALDLNDNDLVVNNGSFAALQPLVLGGYRGGPDTTATGIVSTTSQTVHGGTTILALFDNSLAGFSDFPFGSGHTISPSAIVGKYTYIGDTNMDGQVTPQDYTATDSNLGTSVDPAISWFYGDTNFDGNIDPTDYAGIDGALGLGVGNPLSAAAVPEPATLGALFAFGCLAFPRRRRN